MPEIVYRAPFPRADQIVGPDPVRSRARSRLAVVPATTQAPIREAGLADVVGQGRLTTSADFARTVAEDARSAGAYTGLEW